MVQTVCLDESKHAIKILRELRRMKKKVDYCDFAIKVGVDVYRAHMNVLAAGSPYFKAMLKRNTKERHDNEVEMKGVDFECVKICVDFMYTGRFDIPDGKAGALLVVARKMQLHDAVEAINDNIVRSLNVETFFEVKHLARIFEYHDLSAACNRFYGENLLAISMQRRFENENVDVVATLIRSMDLTEEEKLTVTLRWAAQDAQKRGSLLELIKLIQLEGVSSQYLKKLLENHPLVSNDLQLYKLVNGFYVKSMKMCDTQTASSSCSNRRATATATSQKRFGSGTMVLLHKSSMSVYNPGSNELVKCHDGKAVPVPNGEFTAITADSYIYIISNWFVYCLDFKDPSAKWRQMSFMKDNHGARPAAIAFNGSIFVVGGDFKNPTKCVERYDSATNIWQKVCFKPDAIGAATLVSMGDAIFCVGGKIRAETENTFCKLTPSCSSFRWTNLPPLRSARIGCSAVAVGRKIIVMGGRRMTFGSRLKNLVFENRVECYDVGTKQWSLLAPMINDHYHSLAHHVNGSIYAISLGSVKAVDKYHLASNAWHKDALKSGKSMRVYGFVQF